MGLNLPIIIPGKGVVMKFFEKIKIKIKSGKLRQVRVFDIPVIEYGKVNNEIIKPRLILFKKFNINKSKPIFYLKINRNEEYTYLCLQHWIDSLGSSNNDFFILCDKPKLEREVLKRIIFPNANIKFIKSFKNKKLKQYVQKIATKWWPKATFAHLTTFFHAKQNNITEFWNIDADDTMFALEPIDISNMLQNVENYTKSNDIKVISLDMWHSRTREKHWSFGITYVNNFAELFNILNNLTNTEWQNYYKNYDIAFNLDWFFTYLKNKEHYKIESFYFESCYFIHWGNFLINTIGSNICFWHNKFLTFPILKNIYNDNFLGNIPIAENCIKFDLDKKCITDFGKFADKYISNIKFFPPELQKLHNIKIR